jgi:hypothetical protein
VEAPRDPRLAAYLAGRGAGRGPDRLGPGAAHVTVLISEWQHRRGLTGDVAEIGVGEGGHFILLALLRRPGERAVAIDPFDDRHPGGAGRGERESFLADCAAHLGSLDGLVVHECDGLALAGRDLLRAGLPPAPAPRRSMRIVSLRASPGARHTVSGLEAAFSVLVPGGVVCVEGFYDPSRPGVGEGVHRVLASRPDIAAAGYDDHRLFLVRAEDHPAFLDLLAGMMTELEADAEPVELHGRRALRFSIGGAAAASFAGPGVEPRLLSTFGQGGEGVVQLLSGWAPHREPNGTWVTAPRAEAMVTLPRDLQAIAWRDARLSVTVTPFLHPARSSRHLSVTTPFGAAFSAVLDGTARIVFEVPRAAVTRPILLAFEGEAPERPLGLIEGSTDSRTLSFKVKEVEIDLDPEG